MREEEVRIGQTIGVYTITGAPTKRDRYGKKMYPVKCEHCGWIHEMRLVDITPDKKCSHIGIDGSYKRFQPKVWSNKRIGAIFRKMKQRCYTPSDKDYFWYGARGIHICREWLDNPSTFEVWALANGYSDNLTIDRIDRNKDYCPENCRWVSLEDNARYKSTTRMIEVEGTVMSGREWALALGLGPNMINNIARKYGVESTAEFIKRFSENPNLERQHKQDLYSAYMS